MFAAIAAGGYSIRGQWPLLRWFFLKFVVRHFWSVDRQYVPIRQERETRFAKVLDR